MDETMMIYLYQEIFPLILIGAVAILALLVVLGFCIALITVFS